MQDFFCTCKVEIFFSSLGIYIFLARMLRNIYFLLIITWGKFFILLALSFDSP